VSVEAELDELLGEPAATSETVEAVLTHGHAVALELEAERLRIHRKLNRVGTLGDATLDRELTGITARLLSLRARLAEAGRLLGPRPRLSDRGG
jgi:hypothetical protein